MHSAAQYRDFFNAYLADHTIKKDPDNLYDPITYVLSLREKQMHPVLTLATAEIFGISFKLALPAALAVDTLCNSSSVHNDIIDDNAVRSGKPAVHKKWNRNTAILSGDTMLILSFHYLMHYEPAIALALSKTISRMSLEVCRAKCWDADFESRQDAGICEYLKIIESKTAVPIASAMKIGALISQTSPENCDLIYNFGLNLGLAFHLQQDYLIFFGDTPALKAQRAGDGILNKKNFLYLKALEFAPAGEKQQLAQLYETHIDGHAKKTEDIIELLQICGIQRTAQETIRKYTFKACEILDQIDIDETRKVLLKAFAEDIMGRRL